MEPGAIGELVASIAVIITLIALMFQVRLNTQALNESEKSTTAQIYQARADSGRRAGNQSPGSSRS